MHGGGDTPYAVSRPERIGPFLLRGLVGRGGTAEVHAAVDERDGSAVALKVANRAGAVRATFFRREASLAARLRHPHVVRLVTSGTLEDERPFLAFEHVEGTTLEGIAGRLDASGIVSVGEQLMEALCYAHDAGVVHCDVKPQNVLVEDWEPGRAPMLKLADFGLAGTRKATIEADQPLAGTPGYMSPEQARGVLRLGARSDLYSLGATLYRLIDGSPPHQGGTLFEILDRTARIAVAPPASKEGISTALIDVVMHLLEQRPEHRPASAARALSAWRAAASRGGGKRASASPRPGSSAPVAPAPTTVTAAFVQHSSVARAQLHRSLAKAGAERDVLIGRSSELEEVASSLRRGVRVVQLDAPRGAGASRLLCELEAEDRVLSALVSTREVGAAAPLEALADLALGIARSVSVAASEPAEVLGAALGDAGIEPSDAGRDALVAALASLPLPMPSGALAVAAFAAFDALVVHALERAQLDTVALLVDGAERLDAASRQVLEGLAMRAEGARVVVIVAQAPGAPPFAPDALRETLALGPLHDADAAQLAGAAAPMRRLCQGLPARLVIACAAASRMGEGLRRVESWPALVSALIDAQPDDRRVALALAALGEGAVPVSAIAEIAQELVPGADGSRALAALIELRLALPNERARGAAQTGLRVATPEVGALALSRLSASMIAQAHASIARWLTDEGGDRGAGSWETIAAHATAGAQPRLAAYALGEAAAASASEVGGEATVSLVGRAMDVAARDAGARETLDLPALLAIEAEALLEAGHAARARKVAERAAKVAEPVRLVLRARLAGIVGRALIELRELDLAVEALDSGLEILGPAGDPQELASLLANKGWILGYLQGDNARGIELGRRAMEVAAQIDVPAFRASLCGRLGANLLRAGDWDGQLAINQEDLELSTRARDPRGVIRAHINIGVCFTNRGLLQEAKDHTERGLAFALRHGWFSPAQVAHNNLAMIGRDLGDHAFAERHAREVLELHERLGIARGLGETLSTLARLALARGQVDAAREWLERAHSSAAGVAEAEMVQRVAAMTELVAARTDPALLPPARAALQALCESDEPDPYERAGSRVTLAAMLREEGDTSGAAAQEAMADEVFLRLGADPALERRRWVI